MQSYRKILLHWICEVLIVQINKNTSVNTLYLIIHKINGYIEEINGDKYLNLVPTNGSKDTMKSMKNYGTKKETLFNQKLITNKMNIMKNISKSNLIQMMIHF